MIVQGQSQTSTVIRLKNDCPGYTDPAKSKPVGGCLFINNESIGN